MLIKDHTTLTSVATDHTKKLHNILLWDHILPYHDWDSTEVIDDFQLTLLSKDVVLDKTSYACFQPFSARELLGLAYQCVFYLEF